MIKTKGRIEMNMKMTEKNLKIAKTYFTDKESIPSLLVSLMLHKQHQKNLMKVLFVFAVFCVMYYSLIDTNTVITLQNTSANISLVFIGVASLAVVSYFHTSKMQKKLDGRLLIQIGEVEYKKLENHLSSHVEQEKTLLKSLLFFSKVNSSKEQFEKTKY